MLDHLDISIIKKATVLKSIWILPVTYVAVLLITGIVLLFEDNGGIDQSFFQKMMEAIWLPFYVMMMTAVIWLPIMIFMLIVEGVSIRKSSNQKTVLNVFIFETMLIIAILGMIFSGLDTNIKVISFLSLVSAQVIRWLFLKKNGRMFCKSKT